MATSSNPIQPSESGLNRSEQGRFVRGVSGNPNGRPRGAFSTRTLRHARRNGNLDRVVEALYSKAAGAATGSDGAKASLEAIGFLRDTLDGPLQSNSESSTQTVNVLVENIGQPQSK